MLKRLARAVFLTLLLAVAVLRAYLAIVPWGASFIPWTMARVDGPWLKSPDGQRTLRVHFNDAGALRSGNHWSWIVEDSWLWGRYVVTESFLDSGVAVSGDPVPLQWGPNNEARVQFRAGRYK